MIRVVLRGLAARRLRSALTTIAIVLGVAMISGAAVQTDRIRGALDTLSATSNRGTTVVVRAREAFRTDAGPRRPVAADLADRVRRIDGVARVEGRIEEAGALLVDGQRASTSPGASRVLSAVGAPFDPTQVVRGRAPRAPGEVAVTRGFADEHAVTVGTRSAVTTRSGVHPVTVTGVVTYGGAASAAGTDLVVASLADVQRWYGREGRVTELLVAGTPGVSDARLARRVADVLPAGVEARTGTAAARAAADDAAGALDAFVTPVLTALAAAALLVGAFIIFNTFSVTVAQRTRELAVLRALGATRRGLLGAVLAEAALLGAVASVIGLAAGLGIAVLLGRLGDAAGLGVPAGDLTLRPATVATSLAVGIGTTLAAALVPAVRATRVDPVTAMRSGLSRPAARGGRLRPALAAGATVAGAGLLAFGVLGPGDPSGRVPVLIGGAVALFVGAGMAARSLVRPLATAIGWPLARLFGEPGRLARDNAVRSPERTAASAASLMVALALVVFVAVVAAGVKSSITDTLQDRMRADVMVTGNGAEPLPTAAGAAILRVPQVRSVAPYRAAEVRVAGAGPTAATVALNGMDPATLLDVYTPRWVEGSDADVRALRGDRVIVEEGFAQEHDLAVGRPFTIETAAGRRATLTPTAVYRDPLLLSGMIVAPRRFVALTGADDALGYFVAAVPGAADAAVAGVAAAVGRTAPGATVESRDAYRASTEDRIESFAQLLYALLAMSVVVALFGVVNSVFLSVFERTREFALLRAVGATQAQVRRVVRLESVITAVIGAATGAVVGLALAVLAAAALRDLGLGLAIPAGQLVGLVVLAIAVGVVGAALPARRAARVAVVTAMRGD